MDTLPVAPFERYQCYLLKVIVAFFFLVKINNKQLCAFLSLNLFFLLVNFVLFIYLFGF